MLNIRRLPDLVDCQFQLADKRKQSVNGASRRIHSSIECTMKDHLESAKSDGAVGYCVIATVTVVAGQSKGPAKTMVVAVDSKEVHVT